MHENVETKRDRASHQLRDMRVSPEMSFRACLLVTAASFALLLSACGSSKSQQATTGTRATNPFGTPIETVFLPVYFVRDGKTAAIGRDRTALVTTLELGRASIGALLDGPNAAERRIGFSTTLAADTELRKIRNNGDRLTVKLSKNLDTAARAQVVMTLIQAAGARDVVIVTPAGRTQPLDQADFEDLIPAVLIESPLPFGSVESPLHVSGSSNTFEATSQLELLDANGKLLASKTVTASSGTGTRGTFSVSLRFKAPVGAATLVSYEESAKDGSHIDVVRIPLRISR